MRICIDARMMGPENTRGIGRYIEELVRAMLDQGTDDRFVLIVRKPDHPFKDEPNVETVVADVPWYGLAEQRLMPDVFRRAKADLVHVPHWNVPIFFNGPLVVTIHDLILRHYPASAKTSTRGPCVRWLKNIGYRATISQAVKHAEKILVPAEFTKQDVESSYPESKGKIIVTGEGMPSIKERGTRYEERGTTPFLLYVGSAYPHKGLEDLLDVWLKIVEGHPDLRLVLAGELDVFMLKLKADAEKQKLRNVEFLGRVSDERLAELYSDASALVFPSHFEGFGLPPLEALAHGCPVISSDVASLPEVLGKNGATYFRTGDSGGIIEAVEKVLADPEKAKQAARQISLDLVQRHSWKKTARLTLETYREVIGNHHL